MNYLFWILIFHFSFFILHLPSAWAQTMSNSQYMIKGGNLNDAAGLGTNSQYNLNETVGQTSANLYSGTNYTVKAGFQYLTKTKGSFSFTISQNLIDFGTLTPTNPVSRTTNLTVSNPPSSGFTVIASENQPLKSDNSAIPDTSCDNGDCTPLRSGIWNGTLTYGFGFRCDNIQGSTCPLDFTNSTLSNYKPFALSPSTQTIMSSTQGNSISQSQITYKINISSSQPNGTYRNVVTYIASPGF